MPLPHFEVLDGLMYGLSRDRIILFLCIGTQNEILYVGKLSEDKTKYESLVCIHSYDYDGYLTEERLKSLLTGITGNRI